MKNEITKYDLHYNNVKCIGVDWENKIFHFEIAGKSYIHKQKGCISCSADTDHIRCVIDEFINDIKDELFLKFLNEELFQEFINKGEGKND